VPGAAARHIHFKVVKAFSLGGREGRYAALRALHNATRRGIDPSISRF
jgi:hypothetical protein